jgi:hypothetical protein
VPLKFSGSSAVDSWTNKFNDQGAYWLPPPHHSASAATIHIYIFHSTINNLRQVFKPAVEQQQGWLIQLVIQHITRPLLTDTSRTVNYNVNSKFRCKPLAFNLSSALSPRSQANPVSTSSYNNHHYFKAVQLQTYQDGTVRVYGFADISLTRRSSMQHNSQPQSQCIPENPRFQVILQTTVEMEHHRPFDRISTVMPWEWSYLQ